MIENERSDLGQHLQSHLGTAYLIERELRGGGMSRVFVGTDRNLARQVVIKVLPPGLAATVSIERFKREIMLSAALQHPHIVPVLSAGEIDGLPYFIMPFIAGESARARVTRGPLSVRETVSIMKDVARALAYAHAKGVVHRDIKPDNILMSSGAAVVTDFGVAKALVASRERSGPPAGGSITGVGISLGTPQYMAPEQAAADPKTDHRADIYALGIVAYEMLVGAPPFHGRTPQALLAAQLTELPEPIATRRYDVPAPLSELIMRCLEKLPASRPKTAEEVLRALDNPAVVSGATLSATGWRHASGWPSYAGVGGITLLLIGVATWQWWSRDRPASVPVSAKAVAPVVRPAQAIAVLPLASVGRATGDADAAAGMTSALTSAVAQVSGMRVVSQTAASAARDQLKTLPEMARALNVTLLVEGSVQRQREEMRVELRLVDVARDSTVWARRFDGPASDVFKLQDDVSRALIGVLQARVQIGR